MIGKTDSRLTVKALERKNPREPPGVPPCVEHWGLRKGSKPESCGLLGRAIASVIVSRVTGTATGPFRWKQWNTWSQVVLRRVNPMSAVGSPELTRIGREENVKRVPKPRRRNEDGRGNPSECGPANLICAVGNGSP